MKQPSKALFLWALPLTIALIFFCYYYIDQQLVWFLVKHQSRNVVILNVFANDLVHTMGAFVFLFFLYFIVKYEQNRLNVTDKKLVIACNAIVIAVFVKDILKIIFGRYWAATFTNNNSSLITHHAYGFNWFTPGAEFSSFPSGHTAMIFAFSTSMCLLFPTLRTLWYLLAGLVVIGQIGMYYHFVSDVIAGALLGSLIAFYNYRYATSNEH